MKKREFLDLLKFYLKDMPTVMVDDIISDYEEHFQIAMENGKTQEQVCDELGSPELIAKDYINNEKGKFRPIINEIKDKTQEEDIKNFGEKKNYKKTSKNIIWIVFLVLAAIIFIPPIFGVGVALIASILGLFAVVISIVVSIFALGLGSLAFGIAMPFADIFETYISIPDIFLMLHPITRFFLAISSISIGILTIYFGFIAIYAIYKFIKNILITINWKQSKRRQVK